MTAFLQAYIAKQVRPNLVFLTKQEEYQMYFRNKNMDFFPISVNHTPFFFFCVLFHMLLPC